MVQRVENVALLAGKTITVSFWCKANTNLKLTMSHANYYYGGYSSAGTIFTTDLSTQWTKKAFTITVESLVGKSVDIENLHNTFTQFHFIFDAGNSVADNGGVGRQSGTIDIAEVQVEMGTKATPFEYRPIAEELALCQRYFQSYLSNNNVISERTFHSRFTSNHEQIYLFDNIKIPTMRTIPSVALSVLENGVRLPGVSVNEVRQNDWSVYCRNDSSFSIYKTITPILVSIISFDATLSAEL